MIRDPQTLPPLLDSVRRFVREQLVPAERLVDETDEIPPRIVGGTKAIGLFGMKIPEAHVGLGLTTEEEVEVVFKLTQTSPAFRSLFGTTVGIGSQGLVIDGTPAQKHAWLPRMARGEPRDAGRNITEQAACAKLFASGACGRIADRAVQICGGAGHVVDSGIERFRRDVRLFRLSEGTTQIPQPVIVKHMLRELPQRNG